MRNKAKILFCLFLLLNTLYSQAQIMEIWGWKKLAETDMLCHYKYVHYNSVTEVYVTETTYLEISKSISKFYSYNTFEYDSLAYVPSGKKILNDRFKECLRRSSKASEKDRMKILMEIPSRESEFIIYKNYPEKEKILVQDAIAKEYYKYIEEMPLQSWKIEEDTMNIIGYPCQKAICKWRGREYVAWFTIDIPVNDGPYKFCGLPGLIMKVEDSEQLFCFTIQGIRKEKNKGIYLAKPRDDNKNEYKDADRKEVLNKKAKNIRSMIRRLNHDMQQIGKASQTSESRIDIMERDYQ